MTDFKRLQQQFSGHIRDPKIPIIDGIEERRMKIYRDLFFNNIDGFVSSAFPITKSLMSRAWWQKTVGDFLLQHRCGSPYFSQISKEFLTYITEVHIGSTEEPPFLQELMHYEWVELALDIAEDIPDTLTNELTDELLLGHPVLSPLAWPLNYTYPVHHIGTAYQPKEQPEQPTWLMVYRDKNDAVKFLEMNAITAHLIHLLTEDEQLSGQDAILKLAKQLNYQEPSQLIPAGQEILQQFYTAGILLGARSINYLSTRRDT